MKPMSGPNPIAWQPVTPRGVAAFAGVSLGRLLLVQGVVAALAGGAIMYFLHQAWFPPIREAISRLPDESRIRNGVLTWRGDSPARLAGNRFLTVAVDLWHEAGLGRDSHLAVEFSRTGVWFTSLLGSAVVPYPRQWIIEFNAAEVVPWWGAWEPWLAVMAGVGVAVALWLAWMVLAMVHWLPAWLLGYFLNRQLRAGGAWKLAAAVWLPAGLLFAAVILGYALGWLDPLQLLAATSAQLLLGWFYLGAGVWALPRLPETVQPKNPFASPPSTPSENPFTRPAPPDAPQP